jgi:hypothetical protein
LLGCGSAIGIIRPELVPKSSVREFRLASDNPSDFEWQ